MSERAGGTSGAARLRQWLDQPLAGTLRRVRGGLSWRRIGRWAAVALLVIVASASWGVATASTEASMGPHLARYEVTLDHEVTVDLGPIGTLVIDSPLPPPLGARVVVHEIPREVTAVDPADTLAALGGDLQGYVQFFSAPQATLGGVVHALVVDAARRALLAVLLVTAVALGVRAVLGRARRTELHAALGAHLPALGGAVTIGVLVALTATSSGLLPQDDSTARAASAVFDGTPLEGARISGRLAGVIDTYGGYVIKAYRDNQQFYDKAVAGVRDAWEVAAARDAQLEAIGHAAAGPAASTEPVPEEESGAEPVVMMVVSDVHCNVGMARVVGALADVAQPDIVLNAGDTTVDGTAVESYCVTALASAVPAGATMVVSDGNHDSSETQAQERSAGERVLDGEVIEVDGVRILGDSDPSATRIGVGTTQAEGETFRDLTRRLSEVACADPDGVDLLLVHNPDVGTTALEDGCVPAQVSGHLHRRIGPSWMGRGARYVSSSTAGATLGQATVGPLNGVAEITLLRFDPEARRIIDYRLVRVAPDATVSVGLAVRWPGGPPVPAQDRSGPR